MKVSMTYLGPCLLVDGSALSSMFFFLNLLLSGPVSLNKTKQKFIRDTTNLTCVGFALAYSTII